MIVRALGAVLCVGLAAAMVGLSSVPWPVHEETHGLIRLSWRMRGEVVEACRQRSAEELEELPAHMRNPEACEGRATTYRLRVTVDGEERSDELVRPAGARGDRPIYVFRDVPVAPGSHTVVVAFVPVDSAATSAPLELDATVEVEPREIVLITFDPEVQGLVVRP